MDMETGKFHAVADHRPDGSPVNEPVANGTVHYEALTPEEHAFLSLFPAHYRPALLVELRSKLFSTSSAFLLLNAGFRVSRMRWNGPGQFVVKQKGYPGGIPINKNTAECLGKPEGEVCFFRPYLLFCDTIGNLVPWVASQADLLGDDWFIRV